MERTQPAQCGLFIHGVFCMVKCLILLESALSPPWSGRNRINADSGCGLFIHGVFRMVKWLILLESALSPP